MTPKPQPSLPLWYHFTGIKCQPSTTPSKFCEDNRPSEKKQQSAGKTKITLHTPLRSILPASLQRIPIPAQLQPYTSTLAGCKRINHGEGQWNRSTVLPPTKIAEDLQTLPQPTPDHLMAIPLAREESITKAQERMDAAAAQPQASNIWRKYSEKIHQLTNRATSPEPDPDPSPSNPPTLRRHDIWIPLQRAHLRV